MVGKKVSVSKGGLNLTQPGNLMHIRPVDFEYGRRLWQIA